VKPRPPLPPGPFLVLGLERSGQAAAAALARRGEEVIAVDARHPAGAGRLAEHGVEVRLDEPGVDLVPRARTLVKSPGVPAEAPPVRAARAAGLTVLGELELGWLLLPNPFVAVTGTNGKTTTVELLGAVFRAADRPVEVAGNVGRALSALAGRVEPDTWVVAECSSFQLEDTETFAPEAAVLLNLGEDHVDRHGTLEAYTAAKLRIFARQARDDVAVVPEGLALETRAERVTFGPDDPLPDADVLLPGAHNRLNAMAAAAAALSVGVEEDAVRDALATFAGVAHRLEVVSERDGVTWVNDSKATNVASTLVALAAFAPPIHLILGGQGKGQDFGALRAPVAERCASVALIGEDAPGIARALGDAAPVLPAGTLERAVATLRERARPGEVVLLSPACASFDQFADFEHRGDRFSELVLA